MKKKKKHKIGKYIILLLVFLGILGAAAGVAIWNKTSQVADYRTMEAASLPLVTVSYLDAYETELHGYVNEMSLVDMRDVIVPLGEDKGLDVSIASLGNTVKSLNYQIRSLNGEQFLDEKTITEFDDPKADTLKTSLKFSDLLESGEEYHLRLAVTTDSETVYYYTRILYGKTVYQKELMSFAMEFSEATYDREKAASFIVNYIQPEDGSDTTNYYYTTIHSKYTMFTFGNLEVERGDDVLVRITELSATQASITLSYSIRLNIDGQWRTCSVNEFFAVRYRSEKVYLLDYYRTLEEEFSAEKSTAENGRILLGIGSGSNQILNSDNNTYTVFVENREIWSYNYSTNAMSLIFSFKDESDVSNRSDYDHHNMQIVKVTNDGDIDYMVYGYMNRGIYEGEVGICFYRYTSKDNSTKRLFYMPVYQSEQVLMMDLGTLAYVNEEDVCYLRYGDGIYSIDLNSGESVEVSIRAYPGMYAKNARGNVVAWQEGDDLTYPERLIILNMDSQTTIVVNATAGEYVKILGFIGDDIVYGFGRREDSVIQANMDTQQLLTRLLIASTEQALEVKKEYDADGFFIMDCGVYDTRINIGRGVKKEDGTLDVIEDDVLLLTQTVTDTSQKSMLMKRQKDQQKTEYYIQIGKTVSMEAQFSTAVPRFESSGNVNVITFAHVQENVYYVYGYGKLLYVESEINKAIKEAYDYMGVVVDEEMNYIWTRGTRDLIKTISLQPFTADDPNKTLGAALQVVCAHEGIQLRNVEKQLSDGVSPVAIIDEALGEGSCVDLYGCTISEIQYFINEGHPVLAVTGDRTAVVIYGYERDKVYVYFPETGESQEMENAEAEAFFAENNNAFISYK